MAPVERLSTDGTRRIRTDRFTTLTQYPNAQFECWSSLIADVVNVERIDLTKSGYTARARAFDLGKMHFASVYADPMKFDHTLDHVRKSGIDHWLLTFLKRGFEVVRFGDQVLRTESGDMHLVSLAHQFEGAAGANDSIRIFLSRDVFPNLCDLLDARSLRRLEGPLSDVLIEYLLMMERFIAGTRVNNLSYMTESFISLLAATIEPVADNLSGAENAISASRLNQARNFIQENLASPELGTHSICRFLGISRRNLYYLFEPHGGVAHFIKQRRLAACCRAIADSTDNRLISSIAYSYGYLDPALFSKQFHAEFGFTPTEAREAKLSGPMPMEAPPKTFSEWLLQVRNP